MNFLESMFSSLGGLFETTDAPTCAGLSDTVNPETGLPLFGEGHGNIDIGGSALGVDTHTTFNSTLD